MYNFICMSVVAFLGQEALIIITFTIISQVNYRNANVSECSNVKCYVSVYSCYTSTTLSILIPRVFLDEFKVLIVTYSSFQDMDPGYCICRATFPHCFYPSHLIQEESIWVLSIKGCHLMGSVLLQCWPFGKS